MEKYKCLQIYIVEMLNKLVYPVTAVFVCSLRWQLYVLTKKAGFLDYNVISHENIPDRI